MRTSRSPLQVCPGGPPSYAEAWQTIQKVSNCRERTLVRLTKCFLKCHALRRVASVVAGFPLEVCNHTGQHGRLRQAIRSSTYSSGSGHLG